MLRDHGRSKNTKKQSRIFFQIHAIKFNESTRMFPIKKIAIINKKKEQFEDYKFYLKV